MAVGAKAGVPQRGHSLQDGDREAVQRPASVSRLLLGHPPGGFSGTLTEAGLLEAEGHLQGEVLGVHWALSLPGPCVLAPSHWALEPGSEPSAGTLWEGGWAAGHNDAGPLWWLFNLRGNAAALLLVRLGELSTAAAKRAREDAIRGFQSSLHPASRSHHGLGASRLGCLPWSCCLRPRPEHVTR